MVCQESPLWAFPAATLHQHVLVFAINQCDPRSRVRFFVTESARGMVLYSSRNFTSILISHSQHSLVSCQNGLGCTLPQHTTSHALLASPTPCQRELSCGACIGTAPAGALLAAPWARGGEGSLAPSWKFEDLFFNKRFFEIFLKNLWKKLCQRESCEAPWNGAMKTKCLLCRKNARSPVPVVCRVWVVHINDTF